MEPIRGAITWSDSAASCDGYNIMRITLYAPGDTWLHRLDPMTKLLMTGVGVALTFVFSSVGGGAALFLALLLVLGTGGVLRRVAPFRRSCRHRLYLHLGARPRSP